MMMTYRNSRPPRSTKMAAMMLLRPEGIFPNRRRRQEMHEAVEAAFPAETVAYEAEQPA